MHKAPAGDILYSLQSYGGGAKNVATLGLSSLRYFYMLPKYQPYGLLKHMIFAYKPCFLKALSMQSFL
jgi:hypothetical protein